MVQVVKIKSVLRQKRKMRLYYIIPFFLLFHQNISGQDKPVLFSHLTTNEGLSHSSVNCILKDKYGFLWFGTDDGLNKYDGYTFKVFRNHPSNPKTIPYNTIMCLFEDKSGELWVGTSGRGIVKYNREDDSFTSYGEGLILSIYESSDSTLWLGTYHGFKIFDRKTKKIIPASSKNNQLSEIENLITSCVYEDSRLNLWIINSGGIFLLNKKSGRFRKIESFRNPKTDNQLSKIFEDRNA
jgi:ligand-binding sensor domain-containing protein